MATTQLVEFVNEGTGEGFWARIKQGVVVKGRPMGYIQCENPDEWTNWAVYNADGVWITEYKNESDAKAGISMAFQTQASLGLLADWGPASPAKTFDADRTESFKLVLEKNDTDYVMVIGPGEWSDSDVLANGRTVKANDAALIKKVLWDNNQLSSDFLPLGYKGAGG